ncbi:peptidoglycan D,D-transpeptidase FtsI family protein [Pilimelia columellifera]|uniref:Cell division protein FtsI n=1 Tax=Pilimelia columellifera subsp. columellifera TaxID=706583 RepID=A0ABN3NA75_9ACTN
MPRSSEPPVDGGDPPRRAPRRGLGDARSYTPRGRALREQPRSGSADGPSGRSADPFRPALRVLDGGEARSRSGRAAPKPSDDEPRGAGRRVAAPRGAARAAATATDRTPGQRGRAADSPPRRGAKTGAPSPRSRVAGRTRRAPGPPPTLGDPRRRLRLATVLVLAMFAALGVRLVAVQVGGASDMARDGLRLRLTTVALPAERGSITDRHGAVLAHSVESRLVYVDPALVKDPDAAAKTLAPLLGVPVSQLLPKVQKHTLPDGRESRYAELKGGLPRQLAEKVMALGIEGVQVAADERREVPGHDLAANLIGFVGDERFGLEGLEARYDELLRGRPGELEYETGASNGSYSKTEIPGGYRRETPAQPGSSLRLTIDRDVQFHAQRTLYEHMRSVRADWGAAVVLDARNGEVLSQVSYPTYDAADPIRYPAEDREDRASAAVVDPGSVHKALVMGAALQEGVLRPDMSIMVGPTIKKGDQVFRDTHPNYKPRAMSLAGIMAYSSNVGTIRIADELGAQKLYEYQKAFGLGRATGEGVAGEAEGLVQPPSRWSGSSYGSVPIGHGVAVTPVQMAAAYGAIANDGTWVQPHLIREVLAPDGKARPAIPVATRRVLSPENAAAVRQALEAVVSVEGATGTAAAIRGYRVAGKTGTGAQVVGGRYVASEVASFVGMAPAENPRFVIAVFARSSGGGGGAVAAPAFRDIMSFVLSRSKTPPTLTPPPRFVLYP